MQRGQIFIFLLIGILIIAGVGGAYYLGRSTSPKPSATPIVISQTPQPTPDASREPTGSTKTANWKVFESPTYGFSYKYPTDWENDNFCQNCPPQPIIEKSSERYLHPKQVKYPEGITYIIEDKRYSLSLEGYKNLERRDPSNQEVSDISIGGYRGIRIKGTLEDGSKKDNAIFENKNYIFKIYTHKGYADILDGILSTFKFTK